MADYCIVDTTQAQPSASKSVSKCGGSKAFFVKSLDSEPEWKTYQQAEGCRAKESDERRKLRNAAVKAWFKAVAAARSSKATYIKAMNALSSRRRTMAAAQKKRDALTKTANHQARSAQRALLAWRSAVKAQTNGNAA